MDSFVEDLWIHLLESTLWILLLMGSIAGARIQSSNIRCFLYRVCLLKFVIPTCLMFGWLAGANESHTLAVARVVAEPAQGIAQVSFTPSYSAAIVAVWLLVTAALLGSRILVALRFGAQLKRLGSPFDGRVEQALKRTVTAIGGDPGRLRGSYLESGPVTGLYGIFRPGIIARRAFFESLDDEELRVALQHEVAHWTRRDNLWAFALEFVACLFWFHPLAWMLRKRVTLEMEKACDERVVAVGSSSGDYVNCLVKAAAFSVGSRFPALSALSGNSLKQRLEHLTRYRKMKRSIRKMCGAGAIALCFLASSLSLSTIAGAASDGKIYSMDELDVKPSVVVMQKPVYPEEEREAGIKARVVVEVILTAESEVASAEAVVAPADHPAFEESALEAVRNSTWQAGEKDGEPVAARFRLPIIFTP